MAASIKNLPLSERIQLVEDIWDGIAEGSGALELSAGQRQELDRRLSEHLTDPASSIPWDRVRARLSTRRIWRGLYLVRVRSRSTSS